MRQVFDCSCCFGLYRTRVFRYARTAVELLDEMDFCGIDRALVYHTSMRLADPNIGNERIVQETCGLPRLVPAWSVLPGQTGEQPSTDQIVDGMRQHHVRALYLFPEEHRYQLDRITWGEQLDVYSERRIPIFVKASLDKIGNLLRDYPELVVVTGTQGSNPLDRYAWPLIERYPNLYFETSSYQVDGILDAFCRRYGASRLLFGSGYPDHCAGASLLMVAHADISEEDRQAIYGENLSRLLAEVVL